MTLTYQEQHIVTALNNPGQSPLLAQAQASLNANGGILPDSIYTRLQGLLAQLKSVPYRTDEELIATKLLAVHDRVTGGQMSLI